MTRRPLTVLVVDDSPTVRAVVADALAGTDATVVEGTDGAEVVLLARMHRPDVVLLDVQMPDVDGMTALRMLREDDQLGDVPVVMLTRNDAPEDIAAALDAGADDHLRKPFEPIELRARVAAAGRTGQLLAELRRVNAELARVASTDQLTGLANRREVDHSLRSGGANPLTVLLMDVDHFKQINDVHGHDVGDAVLRELAVRLRTTLRDADVVGRWGGEEFVAMLPGSDRAGAEIVCDRIMDAVRAPLAIADGPERMTISIGVAFGTPSAALGVDDLLKAADRALYRAKDEGRDRAAFDGG